MTPKPYPGWLDWLSPEQQEKATEERMKIKSGLYYNTEPPINIYYVNEYLYNGAVYFSNDGVHFAYMAWARAGGFPDLSGEAIRFYENGSFVKSYKVSDVLKNVFKAIFSVSHVQWQDWGAQEYDRQQSILTVTALDGCVTAFDITTGKIIRQTGGISTVILIPIGFVISLIIFLVAARKKKNGIT